jgi:hypothetical protein
MSRKTHLVGAFPGHSGAHAMETMLERLGPHLVRLTDGETGERSMWVLILIDSMRAQPDVELVDDGGYTDFDDVTRFALRPGRTLDATQIDLGYHRYANASYPRFKVLRERHGCSHVTFQVGMPAPADLAIFTFGPEAALSNPSIAEAYLEATLRELELIRADLDDDVIFQIESVACMVSVATAPEPAQPEIARQNAAGLVALAERAPAGTRFGLHLCLADFHHKAMAEMGSARPLVTMANEVMARWPDSSPLEYLHAPFAAADKPGSFAEEWYEPLSELRVPEGVRFVAGFIHEDLDVDMLRSQLGIIERQVGHQVDIACTCGLGRRPTVGQVSDAIEKTVALIDAPGPSAA